MARLVSSSPTCGTSRTPGRAAPAVGRLVSASGALPVGCQCCQCETRSNRQLAHQDHEQDNNHLLGAGMEVRGLGWGGAGRQGGDDAVSGALQDGGGGQGVPCLQSPYSSADRWGHKRRILGPTHFLGPPKNLIILDEKYIFARHLLWTKKGFFFLCGKGNIADTAWFAHQRESVIIVWCTKCQILLICKFIKEWDEK